MGGGGGGGGKDREKAVVVVEIGVAGFSGVDRKRRGRNDKFVFPFFFLPRFQSLGVKAREGEEDNAMLTRGVWE